MSDIQELEREYLDALQEYSEAAKRTASLLNAQPITGRPVPTISPKWVEAMEAEREAQKIYEAARDAYWTAAGGE